MTEILGQLDLFDPPIVESQPRPIVESPGPPAEPDLRALEDLDLDGAEERLRALDSAVTAWEDRRGEYEYEGAVPRTCRCERPQVGRDADGARRCWSCGCPPHRVGA